MAEASEQALRLRIRELEAQVQGQVREIRALEKIELLQDRHRDLEAENRNLRERVAELHTFLNLSKTLSATLNMEELFRLALHLIGRALHVDAYALLLLDESGERLVVKAAFGLPEEGTLGLTVRRAGRTRVVEETIPLDAVDPLAEEMAEFARCVRNGGRPEVGGDEATFALAVVLAAIESGALGASVKVDDLFATP